jgi:hypothetical protein
VADEECRVLLYDAFKEEYYDGVKLLSILRELPFAVLNPVTEQDREHWIWSLIKGALFDNVPWLEDDEENEAWFKDNSYIRG